MFSGEYPEMGTGQQDCDLSLNEHLASMPTPPPLATATPHPEATHIFQNMNMMAQHALPGGGEGTVAGITVADIMYQPPMQLPFSGNNGDGDPNGSALFAIAQQFSNDPTYSDFSGGLAFNEHALQNTDTLGVPYGAMGSNPSSSARPGPSTPAFSPLPSPNQQRVYPEASNVLPVVPQAPRRGYRLSAEMLIKCTFCLHKSSSRAQIEEHMEVCRRERAFQCTGCPKRFKTSGGLAQHLRIHKEEKNFICAHCSKRFTQKSHVDQHERIHTGQKPFSCRLCGRSFRQKSQQIGHEKTHTATLAGLGYGSFG